MLLASFSMVSGPLMTRMGATSPLAVREKTKMYSSPGPISPFDQVDFVVDRIHISTVPGHLDLRMRSLNDTNGRLVSVGTAPVRQDGLGKGAGHNNFIIDLVVEHIVSVCVRGEKRGRIGERAPSVNRRHPAHASYRPYQKYYVPSEWLAKRGFSPATLLTYEVGLYDNPKRQSAYKGKILLPVTRWKDGELVAYLARTSEPKDGQPKYIWPKGFQKSLEVFGAFLLKERAPIRVLYLVESPFAVMKFLQHGLPAVSCFGWSVSDEQCRILAELAKGVIYLPDRDKTRESAVVAGRLSPVVWLKMPELPDGVDDPEFLTAEQIRFELVFRLALFLCPNET